MTEGSVEYRHILEGPVLLPAAVKSACGRFVDPALFREMSNPHTWDRKKSATHITLKFSRLSDNGPGSD